jgi:hypothetical protein
MAMILGLATLCRAPGFYTAFSNTRERKIRLRKPVLTGAQRRDGEAATLQGALAHVFPFITHFGTSKELWVRQKACQNRPRSHRSSGPEELNTGQQELPTAQKQWSA